MTSIKHKILFLFIFLQLIGAIALVGSFFVELWYFELLVSFTPILVTLLITTLIASSALVAISIRPKRDFPLLAATCMVWLFTLFIVFYTFTAQKPITFTQSVTETITFATFNKLYDNHDTERFTSYLKQQNIDILALQEMRPAEVEEVSERLGFEHAYTSRTFATSGGTSVVLLSHFPFVSVETVELATDHPVIRAEIETPKNGRIVVYSVHIPVPSSPFLYNKRSIVLNSLSETIKKEKLPVIIGGDFNTTVFSPAMQKFSSTVSSSIHPIATQKIPACSWYGYGQAACIRIDHIFAPKDALIKNFRVGPDLGSDHRALIADISIRL